ncbi:hypothetical protein BJ741DRAFT_585357 [Chytriomyces cf. hyalinus JEL632]|nr:hypothetical protein BJ741DRAFT_639408 [Chytriomyces cf. hyalinus JEL632]KAI8820332.1 hypothetical protein BJ741DRAFT_639158 [Chytriomyces cf. hyalinus JEL632]KAI8820335.1 hypothetical protein BJ741DRAFT_639110 [Chytriomyces cf. hyalinus JEL632]KAI8820338.1 hypothetical protein BJ741DRAFT_639067 [Chytriomyces cf. hyalinus JEL632]KAI8824596.1 hypothetical protein BJ741DRAFT_633395 [Chytriomyces cf. hyalinus JEL632]
MELSDTDDGSDMDSDDGSDMDSDDAASDFGSSHFYPFPSRTHALLFSLLFAKRRRISITQMKLLWGIFELLQVKCPSLNAILKLRKKLCKVQPIERKSASGIQIFVRPIPELIESAFATPSIAKEIRYGPQLSTHPQEIFESLAFSVRAPCLWMDNNSTRFYAGDTVVMPNFEEGIIKCFPKPGIVAFGQVAEHFHSVLLQNFTTTVELHPGDAMTLVQRGNLSIRANGRKVINFPVICSSDETSGNTTKRYNHFENFFVIFPLLPHKFYGPRYINFAATTNTGSWSDIAEVVLHDLREGSPLSLGIKVLDSSTGEDVIVVSQLLAMLVDNPRAAQICHQAGARSDFNCRVCTAPIGSPSTCMQLHPYRWLYETKQVLSRMAQMNKTQSESLRKATGITVPSEHANIYLSLPGFSPHAQTPVEILHTLLLGVMKYLGTESKEKLKSRSLKLRAASLFAIISTYQHCHLSSKQVTRYIGSMNGKDFKGLAQIGPLFFPWLQPNLTWLWLAGAILTKLAYDSKYPHFELRYRHLQKATIAVQRLFHVSLPSAKDKLKVHLLSHLPDNFRIWGPLSLYAVEVPEQMNGDVRKDIANSNRHSPSRDVAWAFAIREGTVSYLRGASGGGPGLLELGANSIIVKHLFPPIRPVPSRARIQIGRFFFFDNWGRIGKVIQHNEHTKTCLMQELELNGQLTSWRLRACSLHNNFYVPVGNINDQADVSHDCWEEQFLCSWRQDGSIAHSTLNTYFLNPFRMECHHTLGSAQTDVFLDFLLSKA